MYSINYPDIRCLLSLISCTEEYVNHISFDSFRLFIFSTEEVSDLKNILQRRLNVTVLKVSEHRYRNAVNRHLLISTWEVVSAVFVLIVCLFISPGPVSPSIHLKYKISFYERLKVKLTLHDHVHYLFPHFLNKAFNIITCILSSSSTFQAASGYFSCGMNLKSFFSVSAIHHNEHHVRIYFCQSYIIVEW